MLVKINVIIKDMMNNTTQSLNLHEIPFPNSNGHSAISVPTYLVPIPTYLVPIPTYLVPIPNVQGRDVRLIGGDAKCLPFLPACLILIF